MREHSVRPVRAEPSRTARVPAQLRHLLASAALAAALARAPAAAATVASRAARPTFPPLPACAACAALPPRGATLLGRG